MADRSGWIKIHRSLAEHPLITQLPDAWLKVFIVILLKVNWKCATWWNGAREVEVSAGSMITSVDKLAQFSGASKKQVRGCLEYLQAANMAAIETTNKYTHLTILNWETYQSNEATEGKQDGELEGNKRASWGQTKGKHRGNNRRSKELRTKEHTSNSGESDLLPGLRMEPNPKAQSSKGGIDPDTRRWFEDEFWPIYPRLEAKATALTAAAKKASTPEKRAFCLDRLKAQLPEYLRRKAESGQRVIPLGATWFNQDRAEDELPLQEPSARGRHGPVENDYPEYVSLEARKVVN